MGQHRVSPSRLKKISGESPRGYLSSGVKETDDIRLGKIVEALFFENKRIYTVLENISEVGRLCGDYLYMKNLPVHDVYLLQYANGTGYCSKMSDKVRIKRLRDTGVQLYTEKLNKGLILIDSELEKKAIALTNGLKNNKEISELLALKGEIQKKIEFEYNSVKCKGYIDYFPNRVIDLKVVSQPWKNSAKQFRWDIQGAFYKIPYPKTLNPLFIVARSYAPDRPLLVEMSDADVQIAMHGLEVERTSKQGNVVLGNSYKIEGIDQLLERYKFHSENDLWDYSKEYYEQGERENLNLYL